MLHLSRESTAPVPRLVEEPKSPSLRAITHMASKMIDFMVKKLEPIEPVSSTHSESAPKLQLPENTTARRVGTIGVSTNED